MSLASKRHDSHITELAGVGYFKSPGTGLHGPASIGPKTEKIELITGGVVLFEVDGRDVEWPAGSIFWHVSGENTVHRSVPGKPYRCVVIDFRVLDQPDRHVPRHVLWSDAEEATRFGMEVLGAFHGGGADKEALCRYAYSTLLWKAKYYSQGRSSSLPKNLSALLLELDGDPGSEFSVGIMAQMAGVSEPHLYLLFRKHLGVSPHQYLLNRRLQKARNLLVVTDSPIKQICSLCGFASMENFCRIFAKRVGMTPGKYRDKHSVEHDLV